jgi:Tfp pilus assembly protein PilW
MGAEVRSGIMRRQKGTSAVEMMIVVLVFTLLTGTVFRLLNVSQVRYRMESDVLDSFQGAQVAMDQMARDIHTSGYPPVNSYSSLVVANAKFTRVASAPFAWSPSYPGTPCTVGVTCVPTPSGFDLIVETDIDPQNNNGVEWVRYQLNGTTLMRGVASKTAGADPAAATAAPGVLVPYIDNVMNNATPAQMQQISKHYPGMFPGNAPVPVFTYLYDAGQPQTPPNIREVNITLIVQAPTLDPQTQQPRVLTLTARARRIDPNQ